MEDIEMNEMRKLLILIILILALCWGSAGSTLAAAPHEGHGASPSGSTATAPAGSSFTHKEMTEGVRVEFEIMSLASMNMKDPEGNTHHIMVKFFHDGMSHQINDVVGKIKLISPTGKELVENLQNYSGILAANFTFDEKGKYGVICLFKVDGQNRVVKFWYPHG